MRDHIFCNLQGIERCAFSDLIAGHPEVDAIRIHEILADTTDSYICFIRGIKSATTGRLLSIWQVIRTIASAFSLRIGGHPQFIRPLINPMAQACAIAKYGDIDEKTEDEIKGMAAGTEKYGNFFAQNCFMGSSGTLLIVSTLNEIFKSHNIAQEVTANQIALNSIPIAIISVIVGIGYALWYDRKLKKRFSKKQGGEK